MCMSEWAVVSAANNSSENLLSVETYNSHHNTIVHYNYISLASDSLFSGSYYQDDLTVGCTVTCHNGYSGRVCTLKMA